jgi:ectoine hydroxylase-related dioxygenase (phytanoyl-CoA dioxygenase family)
MEAGDLLIFNSTEPHGIRPNRSGDKVRMAQYISMMPAEEDNEVHCVNGVSPPGKKEEHRKVLLFPVTRENGSRQNMKQRNCHHWERNY